jgi:hypothetical protein
MPSSPVTKPDGMAEDWNGGSFTLGPAEEFEANLVRIFEDCEHLNAASGELFRSVRPYRRARCLEASRKFGERRFVRDLEAKIGDVVRLALVKSNALRLIIVAKRNRPIHGWRTHFHPEHASGKSNPVTWLANFEAEVWRPNSSAAPPSSPAGHADRRHYQSSVS